MLSEALFERVIQWLAHSRGDAWLLAQRRDFESRTGPIEEQSTDFEARMAHFVESLVCDGSGPTDDESAASAYASSAAPLPREELEQLVGWERSHRSLFEFTVWDADGGHLKDLVLGGAYVVRAVARDRGLSEGERFDGRLVALGDDLWITPGRVYHPRAAHVAIDGLLRDPRCRSLGRLQLLDALLHMRSSFMRFESIKAEHIYCGKALSERPADAPWALTRADESTRPTQAGRS